MGKKKKQGLSDAALELVASRFRLLSEPMRLKILHTLGESEKNVTEIVAETGASQANVSKHLGVLLDAAIVSRRKEGLTANYRVVDQTIFDLCDVVCSRLKDELFERQKLLRTI
jgi:DNA-binding transcriptional ArsR family regulator